MVMRTYADAIDAGIAFLQAGGGGSVPSSSIAMAINAAFAKLYGAHNWSWRRYNKMITVGGSSATGTIAYNGSTGQYTLSGGTWPTWAVGGLLVAGSHMALIGRRHTDTICEAHPLLRPADDLSSGTTYTLYRCGVELDAVASIESVAYVAETQYAIRNISVNELAALLWNRTVGSVAYYTLIPSIDTSTRLLLLYPLMASATQLLVSGTRLTPVLSISGVADQDQAGKVSIAAGTTSVTGASTQFHSGHVGAVLSCGTQTARIGGSTGLLQPVWQSVIANVASTTALTVATAASSSLSAVYYRISSPLNMPEYAWPVFVNYLQAELALLRNQKNAADFVATANMAMHALANMDSVHSGITKMGKRATLVSKFDGGVYEV